MSGRWREVLSAGITLSLSQAVEWACGDNQGVTLVEWTRLEPGQVEAVVAMLVNREHSTSVRITPSRGDGGVDILDRDAGPGDGDVVYQVKSYTEGLEKRQKDSIEDSLDTLGTDERWAGLNVVEWRLVTPWNPSPEAETWLHGLGVAAGVRTVWQGLDHLEQLAAKYPDVIDYYLHGGRARIEAAHSEIFALIGMDHVPDGLTVVDVTSRIEQALGVLDHDPHYRFEYRFGQGPPPPPPGPGDRPGLVMHCLRGDRTTSRWVAIDVIARCAASVDEQPITIKGTIHVEPGTDLAREWDAFITYGAPLSVPAGAFTGEIVAPGGLGGSLDGGTIATGPTADTDLGASPEMHLDVLDPDGHLLASVDVDRVERSQGAAGGVRVVLREVHNIFTLEDRYNLPADTASRHIGINNVTGLPVRVAKAGVAFLSHLHEPNRLRVSPRHAPSNHGVVDPNIGFEWDEEQARNLGAMLRILETLNELQTNISTVIRTPDFTAVPREQFKAWRIAAAILRGEEITGTYPEGQCLVVDLASEVTVGEGTFGVSLPHTVTVDDQILDLGRYELSLKDPTLVDRSETADGVAHAFTTADRSFQWRHHDPTRE